MLSEMRSWRLMYAAVLIGCGGGGGESSTGPGPQPSVASVVISSPSPGLVIGATSTLSAIAKDQSGNVVSGKTATWSTSAPDVVSIVSMTPLSVTLKGEHAGSSVLTATIEGTSSEITLAVGEVRAQVATVAVTPVSSLIQVGQQLQLLATVRDASGNLLTDRPVTWSWPSNNGQLTVSQSGLVTALAANDVGPPLTTVVTATSEGVTGTTNVIVTSVASVDVSSPTSTIMVGGHETLHVSLTLAGNTARANQSVAWTSSNPAVATVTPQDAGFSVVVNGVASGGPITLTATADLVSATTLVTVVSPP